MKKPEPKYEQMEVPRLADEVKKMNGKSTRRLKQCIDTLCEVLEEPDQEPRQDAQDRSVKPDEQ